MKEKLQKNLQISEKEIKDIIYSCQIASGSASGVGKIKGIIKILEDKPVTIIEKRIYDKYQLAELIKSIDPHVDITEDRDFKDCF